ncbi:hypothetical protein D9611_008360 [Ephemerocybe angulata]|uniref:Uncharacterized protein n=1 Tax=Ephemerocybe angulata TaxID=980116 RepID=A0A8H5BIJ4_9AGAR|nr:hypothetical protein D9611_008360 [Tulosesus angulatus]
MEMAHFPIVTGLTLIGFDELDRFIKKKPLDSPAEAPIPIVTGFPLIGFDELDRFYEEEASSDVKTPVPSPASSSDCTVTNSPSSSSPSASVPGIDDPYEFDGETALGIVFFYMRAKRIHAETKTQVAENNLKEAQDSYDDLLHVYQQSTRILSPSAQIGLRCLLSAERHFNKLSKSGCVNLLPVPVMAHPVQLIVLAPSSC